MKKLFFFFLIGLPVISIAQAVQDSTITLSGTIIDEAEEPVPYVTITNLSEYQGVVSNEEGFFFIKFNREDTLELSAVGFEKQRIYLGDTAKADNYDMNIRFSEKTYQLENVTVFAYQDEASFKKAILDLELPEERPQVKIPGSYDGPRIEKRASPGSPVSFLYDLFSKRARYEQEAREAQQEYEHRKLLAKKYNRDLVGKITGLKDEALDEFMIFCRFKDAFIDRSNEYDIILAINHCYTDFNGQQP